MTNYTGIKKAVGQAQEWKKRGHVAVIMADTETKTVWCDEFVTSGDYREYKSETIISLSYLMRERSLPVSMENVKLVLSSIQ